MSSRPLALYIHIPFCHHKCPYCAFYKELWSESLASGFMAALERELRFYGEYLKGRAITSIFLGGGTPSRLPEAYMRRLFDGVRSHLALESGCEITIEMNPESITPEYLSMLNDVGINRLSIGVQSFNQSELDFLGRYHHTDVIDHALECVQASGFDNVNLDLIFGSKGSSLEALQMSLDKALGFSPTHLSTYALTIEPGTVFAKDGVRGLPSDLEADHYHLIRSVLGDAGFEHYEVSAFARPGFQCHHNLAYWTLSDYVGIGPSGCSYVDGHYYQRPADLKAYMADPEPSLEGHLVSIEDQRKDFLVTGLRLLEGFSISGFEDRFSCSFDALYGDRVSALVDDGFLSRDGDILKPLDAGLVVLDSVVERLI